MILVLPPLNGASHWSGQAGSLPRPSLLSPNKASGYDSSDSSAFSSRAHTSDFTTHQDSPSLQSHPAEMLPGEAKSSPLENHMQYLKLAEPVLPSEQRERSVSPGKPRPAVFSAISTKDKDGLQTPQRPGMHEKKSMLGKMLDGMRSKDNLHKDKDSETTATRPRGKSTASEPESGNESDHRSSGFGFSKIRRSSGGKNKEKDKESFLTEQERAAAQARTDVEKRQRAGSKPPAMEKADDLSRRAIWKGQARKGAFLSKRLGRKRIEPWTQTFFDF